MEAPRGFLLSWKEGFHPSDGFPDSVRNPIIHLYGMKIELRLYASLGQYLPANREGNSCTLEVETGTTIREVLHRLHVPPDAPKTIFLNGVHAQGHEILKEGDRVGAFPPVAGG